MAPPSNRGEGAPTLVGCLTSDSGHHAYQVSWGMVGDREADIYDLLTQAQACQILVRAAQTAEANLAPQMALSWSL